MLYEVITLETVEDAAEIPAGGRSRLTEFRRLVEEVGFTAKRTTMS